MRKDARETIGLVLVAASMGFVGWQIHQSNVQARAAAYQALGIAVAEYHQNVTPLQEQLYLEAPRVDLIEQWTADDWAVFNRSRTASLRIAETLYIQVEQALLPEDAVESLGYGPVIRRWLASPTHVCLWPIQVLNVSPSLRTEIEAIPDSLRAECPIDLATMLAEVDRNATPRRYGS